MTRQDNARLQFSGAGNGRFEVVNFKPQEHAVSGNEAGIADGTVMMADIPSVQLQDQPAVRHEPFILGASMCTLAPKQTLIPAAARFDVTHAVSGCGCIRTLRRLWSR